MTLHFISIFSVFMMASQSVSADSEMFLDQIFMRTGTKCVTEEMQKQGMPVGEGIKTGQNTRSFKLIQFQINVVCTGMGKAKLVGSWMEFWDPVYGGYRVAPFKAGGDVVLIMHFEELGMLLTKTVPSGEKPEEDWTKPEAPKNRMSSLQDEGFNGDTLTGG